MKKILFSLAFLSLTSWAFGQEKGIKFEDGLSWKEVRTKAKAENKYIFVDVYATWCGPCKAMDADVYPSEKVGTFMNDKFISIKVQADTSKKDDKNTKEWYGEARQIITQHSVKELPAYLFFSPEGKIVDRGTGYKDADALVQLAKDILRPEKQYYNLLEGYQQGNKDYSAFPYLIEKTQMLNDTALAKELLNDYFINYLDKLPEKELFSKDKLEFLFGHLGGTHSKSFHIFLQNRDRVNKILGKDKAEYALRSVITSECIPKSKTWKTSEPDWEGITKSVTAKFGNIGVETVYGNQMSYYKITQDWEAFGKYYVLYFKTAFQRPEYIVNGLTWLIFEKIDDPKILKFASDIVMKYAMGEWYKSDANAHDTYANLLYKLGRKEQAIEWEEKALKMAKGNEYFERLFISALDKMKKGSPTWSTSANN